MPEQHERCAPDGFHAGELSAYRKAPGADEGARDQRQGVRRQIQPRADDRRLRVEHRLHGDAIDLVRERSDLRHQRLPLRERVAPDINAVEPRYGRQEVRIPVADEAEPLERQRGADRILEGEAADRKGRHLTDRARAADREARRRYRAREGRIRDWRLAAEDGGDRHAADRHVRDFPGRAGSAQNERINVGAVQVGARVLPLLAGIVVRTGECRGGHEDCGREGDDLANAGDHAERPTAGE